ncbi:MAG: response regulator [Lachnospiraceae bacterium]|nr:response regulator [Lachnospiraceae bacterium]
MLKVLIADDEEMSRSVISHILSSHFKNQLILLEAENGREAVSIALAEKVDLVFLDIEMPVLDGIHAGWEIRRQLPEAKLVFLTAYAQFGYAKQAISMGAVEYLIKPADELETSAIVRKALSQHPLSPDEALLQKARTPIPFAPARASQARAAEIAKEARHLLDTGYMNEISIEQIANLYHLSVPHFNKIFKQFNGTTCKDYLINLRVEKAKEYLKNPKVNIREAGVLVGYLDPNYFSRIFKKKTGLTPIEYRNQIFFMPDNH